MILASSTHAILREPYWQNFLFVISFYEIMHRTIVQNKIITIICSCLFFVWLIFIGLVQGRCSQVGLTQNNFNHLILSQKEIKKTHSIQNCMHNNISPQIFNFNFNLFLNNIFKNVSKNLLKCLSIYIIIINKKIFFCKSGGASLL